MATPILDSHFPYKMKKLFLSITLVAASFVHADDATVAAYLDNFVRHQDEIAERGTAARQALQNEMQEALQNEMQARQNERQKNMEAIQLFLALQQQHAQAQREAYNAYSEYREERRQKRMADDIAAIRRALE
jgi:hypothetical protein